MSSAMETTSHRSPQQGTAETTARSTDSPGNSHSGSDEEPMPLTPSSGMVRHSGEHVTTNSKESAPAADVEMQDATERASTQDGQRAASLFGGSEALSELGAEDEEEEEEEDEAAQYTQPAEFYPHEHVNRQLLSYTIEAGIGCTPEEDPLATRGIPVFRPTMEEFSDFEGYMERIAPWGHRSGIVKVIPPTEWTESLPRITAEQLENVKIKGAIQQNMQGRAGMYRANNIEKNKLKGIGVKDWWEKCQSKQHKGPGPKDISLGGRGRQEGVSPIKKMTPSKRKRSESAFPPKESAEADKADKTSINSTAEVDETSLNGTAQGMQGVETEEAASQRANDNTTRDAEPDMDAWYQTFDLLKDWLPTDTTIDDYTVDACRELERKFWRGLSLGEPSWYGADLKGSLFTEETTAWNVANLPNVLNRLNLKRKVPGVNTPYLYFGMWAAAFAWHVEDMDLYSINYIHAGAPKFWYAMPQGKAENFERHMAGYFGQDSQRCDQFLRHKSFVVSPFKLGDDACRPNFLVQKQGEFVITYPKGYHAGFNGGFNIAESINFALEDWIDIGRRAKVCKCEDHSVVIDIDRILQESELRNAADAQRAERRRLAEMRKQGKIVPYRKRKVGGPSANGKQYKMRLVPEVVIPRPAKPVYSCVFCPHPSTAGLLPIFEPSERIRNMVKDPNARAMAHVACARCIPELSIATVEEEYGEEPVSLRKRVVVMGSEEVGRERWNLKCASCSDPNKAKMGAKIQCVKGKCTRAYHVTCAMENAEVDFEEVEVQEWVCKKPKPVEQPAEIPATNPAEESMDVDSSAPQGSQSTSTEESKPASTEEPQPAPTEEPKPAPMEASKPALAEQPEKKQYSLVKIVHTKLFCPTHNIALQAARRQASQALLREEILKLPVGYPIIVRSSSGHFESYLLFLSEEDETAGVVGDDGSPEVVKWSQLLHADGARGLEAVPPKNDDAQVDFSNIALTPEMIRMLSSNKLLQMALRSVAV